jgi:citrate lyase subunit beta / citryl-CoA lyase
MNSNLPVWRSLLFVPVTQRRFVDGAARRGADAIILDLEDSVAASE